MSLRTKKLRTKKLMIDANANVVEADKANNARPGDRTGLTVSRR